MPKRKVLVAAHGHCFDGIASAVLFTHLRSRLDPRPVQFRYRSCGYGPNMQTIPLGWLSGDENAIVDFRYTASERLTWYFDHHPTAFASDEERDEALRAAERRFFDPTYGSCTKLIADIGSRRFGVDFGAHAELVEWADRVDAARFETAAQATDRTHPVMQLASVVEQHGDGDLYAALIPLMLAEPPSAVAQHELVKSRWAPLATAHEACRRRMEGAAERRGEVVYMDLHDAPLASSGKFVAYALAPEARYSVAVVRMKQHFKISVGYNPWCGRARTHDIAAICQKHGGGGHAVVGAISIALDDLPRARSVASEIVEALNQ